MSFYRFDPILTRMWMFGHMGLARFLLPKIPGIGFWKLFGSGSGVGFSPVPNTSVYAILATWPDLETARAQTTADNVFCRLERRADESWTVFLAATSVRGEWSGQTPFEVQAASPTTPIAALTRATIKPRILHRFWSRVPDISNVVGSDPNVMFKIGVGEVPWLHQVTFSIWPDTGSMADFARRGGPHARAIKAVREGNWFSEELYARFSIAGERGTWGGVSPLAQTS